MTRTGYITKLASHYGEPFVELHPVDGRTLGVKDATFVDIKSEVGRITARALLSSRVEQGSVFVPMHWTNVFASNARVNSLMDATSDPVSGQPALKHQRVHLSPSDINCYGFLIMSNYPKNLAFLDNWAIAPVERGWKVEFGTSKQASAVMEKLLARTELTWPNTEVVSSQDELQQQFNACWFEGGELKQAAYLSVSPVKVPRAAAATFFNERYETVSARMAAVSGVGRADKPSTGAIVCSCLSIGQLTIEGCIADGAQTVDLVGEACGAGTQCGTCRSEINVLLKKAEYSEPCVRGKTLVVALQH